MLQGLFGVRVGILDMLHSDHQEVAELLDRILAARRAEERGTLFAEMKAKLTAHSQAEAKVLYARMAKAGGEPRQFALEGEVEHEIVEAQLAALARTLDPKDDQWLARVTVLQELVKHHVREEEGGGFWKAHRQFDREALEKLGAEFQAEKTRLLRPPQKRAAHAAPATAKRARRAKAKKP